MTEQQQMSKNAKLARKKYMSDPSWESPRIVRMIRTLPGRTIIEEQKEEEENHLDFMVLGQSQQNKL